MSVTLWVIERRFATNTLKHDVVSLIYLVVDIVSRKEYFPHTVLYSFIRLLVQAYFYDI